MVKVVLWFHERPLRRREMKYRCHLCEYEEEVAGSASDSTEVVAHSKVLGVTVRYANGLVKNLADAEVRHVTKMHAGEERHGKRLEDEDVPF